MDSKNQNDSNSVSKENRKTEISSEDNMSKKENQIENNDKEENSLENIDDFASNENTNQLEQDENVSDKEEIKDVDKENLNSKSDKSEEKKSADKTAENKNESEKKLDYSSLSRKELSDEFDRLIISEKVNNIRDEAESIKALFYKKQNIIKNEVRENFLKNGGNIDDFVIEEDDIEEKFKSLYKKYRKLKAEFNRSLEENKEANLVKKKELIEELKDLINKKESIGDTFKEFHLLQKKWHEIGQIPQKNLRDMWNTYHHHVEKFYDYIQINKELRDIDLKKNLEKKLVLCENAEKLLEEKLIVKAFRTLQKYHNQWREIGPVPREEREELWERFKKITKTINKSHQDYFKKLKDDQKENLVKKTALCEKVDSIVELEIDNHKLWKTKTKEIIDIQKEWRTIGFTPKKDNNRIYARFRSVCDKFFDKKHEFYAKNKDWQEKNLKLKLDICEKVEEIQDSKDWKKTTHAFINYQKDWKNIGSVPRKESDKIWKRFRKACDTFFDRKSEYYSKIDDVYDNNYKLKLELLEKIENYKFDNDVEVNYASLRDFQDEWAGIGFVPYKLKDEIQAKLREVLNKQFDKLKVNDTEKKLLKFKTRLDNLQNKPKSYKKMKHEKEKFVKKVNQLATNITLWENNIGFFSFSSKEGNSVVDDYRKKISEAKSEMRILKEKIEMIDDNRE